GASKLKLFTQFMVENLVVFLLSVPLALIAFSFALPLINYFWNYELEMTDLVDPMNLFIVVLSSSIFLILTALLNYALLFGFLSTERSNQSLKNPIFSGVKRFVLPIQIFI